jgi:O-antigen/teichoic acid export membrane protein
MNFFKNTDKFHGIADSMVISLGRLAAGVALARLAGAEAFAHYILFSMAAVILLNIPGAAIITPMVNLATGMDPAQRRSMIAWTRRRMLPLYKVTAGLAVAAVPLFLYLDFDTIVYAGFGAAVLSLLELQCARACLQALFKMKVALLADTLATLATAGAVTIAYLMGWSAVAGFWWGTALASLSAAWLMRRAVQGPRPADNLPRASVMQEARRSGKAMLAGSLANSACSRIHPFVLGSMASTLALANFGVSWSFIGPMRMLSTALNGILRPRLAIHQAKNDPGAVRKTFWLTAGAFASIGMTGIILSLVLGPWIVHLVFGEAFSMASRLLPLAIAYGTLDALTTSQMVALQTTRQDGAAIASKLRIKAAMISVVLLLPLSYLHGATGAYGALLVAECFYGFRAGIHLGKRARRRDRSSPGQTIRAAA